jgi:hypothetical protein
MGGDSGKKEQEEGGFHKSLTDDLGEIIGGEVRRKISLGESATGLGTPSFLPKVSFGIWQKFDGQLRKHELVRNRKRLIKKHKKGKQRSQ